MYPELCALRPEGKCPGTRRLEITCYGVRHPDTTCLGTRCLEEI